MWSQSRQCFLIITDQHLSLHCICKVVKLALVIICRLVSEFDGFDFRRASRWGWWSGTITWWSTSAIRVSTTGWAWAPSGRPSSSAPPTSTSSKWSDPGIFNRQPLRSLSAKFFSLLKRREIIFRVLNFQFVQMQHSASPWDFPVLSLAGIGWSGKAMQRLAQVNAHSDQTHPSAHQRNYQCNASAAKSKWPPADSGGGPVCVLHRKESSIYPLNLFCPPCS